LARPLRWEWPGPVRPTTTRGRPTGAAHARHAERAQRLLWHGDGAQNVQHGTDGDWPVDGKIFMGGVHGARCTGKARSRARDRSGEEGRRWGQWLIGVMVAW
jgi:hypothetical protein